MFGCVIPHLFFTDFNENETPSASVFLLRRRAGRNRGPSSLYFKTVAARRHTATVAGQRERGGHGFSWIIYIYIFFFFCYVDVMTVAL